MGMLQGMRLIIPSTGRILYTIITEICEAKVALWVCGFFRNSSKEQSN